jgi:hypothetical protein
MHLSEVKGKRINATIDLHTLCSVTPVTAPPSLLEASPTLMYTALARNVHVFFSAIVECTIVGKIVEEKYLWNNPPY